MAAAVKKTRNRAKRPSWTYDGATVELLRSNPSFVTWAQSSPEFRDILTALVNERSNLVTNIPGTTENMQLGVHLGVDRTIASLRSLALGISTATPKPPEQTYEPETLQDSDPLND